MQHENSPVRAAHAVTVLTLLVSAAATVVVMSLSCSGKSKPVNGLVVSSFSPSESSTGDEPIELRFDQPVVPDNMVGETVAAPPVVIQPHIPTTAYWLDRETLVLTPMAALRPSTRYKVELTQELGERTGGFSFSFVNEPLIVEGIWGANLENLDTEPDLPLHFNQPVRPQDVIARCTLQKSSDHGVVSLVNTDAGPVSDQVRVKPATALERDTDYELTCDGLMGDGGNEPMATAFVQKLHTHPTFSVVGSSPNGIDEPADDLVIQLTFSTPVKLDDITASLRAKPRIVNLDKGHLDSTGTTYKTTVTLKSQTDYKITVSGELEDVFEQKMATPYELSFRTGHGRPRLSLETGIFALEPSADGYPVWSRNVKNIEIACAAVPKERIVKLLTSSMDYDPWYEAGSDSSMDWEEIKLTKHDKRITVDQPKNKWHLNNLVMHEVCGGQKPRGLFLAEIHSPEVEPDDDYPWRYRPNKRVLANVTDFGILLEAGTASGLVWVTSLSTGKPVSGAAVTVYTPQGRIAHRGTTDKDGLLRLPGTSKMLRQPGADDADNQYDDYWSYRSQRVIAIVEKGEDLGVIDGNWSNGIQTWNFGVRTDRRGGETKIRGFIQSDRGIYRPGETVHFKGLVREIAVAKAPAVPANARVAIHVEDSRGQGIHDETQRLTKFGGFAFDLPLTDEANLGDYHVTATVRGQTFRERFSVEEFRKVSYEVKLQGTERHGRLGDKLKFEVSADYLFGAPVVDATVEWNVQRRGHIVHFPKFSQYSFGDYAARGYDYYYDYEDFDGDGDYRDDYLSDVSDGEGETDRRGRYSFSVRDPQTDFSGPQDYVVGVAVRDETDQVVSARTVITAHKTDFYLGLHTQEFVQAVDMPFAINAVALSPEGKHVGVKGKLKFIREDYHCTWSEGYRSYPRCNTKHEVAIERDIDIPATGATTETIMPKQPGEYVVRIEATDSRGNEVVASGYVWIIGKGEAFWSGDESARMSLIASKDKYQPGETARLVPRTGMKNVTTLVTLKRNGIMDAYVKYMDSSTDGIEIPLEDVHAPNVFASVAMVTGRTGPGDRNRPNFKMGMTELKVATDQQRLDVVVELPKDSFEPGEPVTGKIRVMSGGQPVSAEVSVSVADEGVLQLIGYKTPDPMNTFYTLWGLGVDSATNWNRIARLNDPAVDDPDMGGDSGPGGGDDRVRSNFVSSAFWAPSLVTDANGEIDFTFNAPDNLTAFRVMAVAADVATRFGSGERRMTIKKPLLAKPALPRFLNTGDHAWVGVVVHNYTGEAGQATITANFKGVYLKNNTRTVELAEDGSARVDFPIKVLKQREATFEFAVEMSEYKDALRLEVPINRPLDITHMTVAEGIGGRDGKQTITVPVTWDEGALVGNHSLITITVDRTGLGDLEPSLRYLIEYPYGCLEQTLSRFIPLTKVKDLAESMGMKDLEGPRLQRFIRAGVAKVARHQHADGHFSLWPSGTTYPHLTVYALYGLTEAKRAGVDVPQDVLDRGLTAMQSWIGRQDIKPGGESATLAMAAYVLAEFGKPDSGLVTRLYEARPALPRYGLAFLLRAMKRSNARAQDMDTVKNELVQAAVMEDSGTAVIRETDAKLSYYMSSDARSSAIALSALLDVDPQNELVDKLVAGLKKLRQPSGYWHNTQANLYALVALADYARRESQGSEMIEISYAGKRELRRRVKGAEVLSFRRYLHNYKPGDVTIDTTGKVRYSVRLTEAREDPANTPVSQGLTVTREYLDPKSGTPIAGNFKAGQLVKVRVKITAPEKREFVAVEDALPAGFEAVNTKLATSADVEGADTHSSWGWTHRELRDDRALAFVDNMYRSEMIMEYLVRAITPGTFMAPPARAEQMYSPEVYGRSAATQVVIKKK